MLGFSTWDIQTGSQAEGRNAIDDAEVSRLGLGTFQFGDLFEGLMVNLCSRGTVNIVSFEEGFNHIRVLAQMGHKSQLNLTIVSTEEDFALVGNKCLAQFAACSIAYRNILQVGIAARKSSRSRNCLVELAMEMRCVFGLISWGNASM